LEQQLEKQGDPQGEAHMARFRSLQKQQQLTDRIQTLGNFGLQAADARNWGQAVADIQQALALCGNCAQGETLHKNLGLIYSRKGDFASAERELNLALKLKPDDPDALKAVQILQSQGKRAANSN